MVEEADFLEQLLHDLPGKTVLILGDVILDEYVFGDVKRISPEAPVPVVEFRSRSHLPGGAANVAANIAAFGCRVVLGGVTGADEAGDRLQAALQQAGVSIGALLPDPERPTTVKLRIIAHQQQIVRLDHEIRRPISLAMEKALLNWLERSLPEADVCVLSDYGKGLVSPPIVTGLLAKCRQLNVPLLVDPKSLELQDLRGATLIKPNKHEAERLVHREIVDEADFRHAGEQLASSLPGTAVLITRGAQGMSLFRHGREPYEVPTVARNVYDVTGAGDTVIGALAAALAGRATLERSMWLASQCAAIAVEKLGTAIVTPAQLQARWRTPASEIVP